MLQPAAVLARAMAIKAFAPGTAISGDSLLLRVPSVACSAQLSGLM
jgi:hypothetical protein